jgi:hypothetical protein
MPQEYSKVNGQGLFDGSTAAGVVGCFCTKNLLATCVMLIVQQQ